MKKMMLAGWMAASVAAGWADAQPVPAEAPRAIELLMNQGGSFLGIGVREVVAERVKELKLKEERGVEVTAVDDDSPASKAGLQKSDVVLEYNGQRVEGVSQFVRMVRETPAGRVVKLQLMRGGALQTVTATVAERDGAKWGGGRAVMIPRMVLPDMPRPVMSWKAGMLGIEGESLEGPLAQYFGVKEGVLVRSVMKDSVAEKAGLRAGDVIVKVGGQAVDSPQEVSNALRERGDQKTVTLSVMREKKETSLAVTFDEAAPEKRKPAPARSVRVQEYRF